MVILEKHITDFCGEAARRMLGRGKNLFASNKVLSVSYDLDYRMLTGKVEASMRRTTYKVWIKLRVNGVEAAGCECVRGMSKCGHMIALLYQASKSVSSTSMSCQWSKKKTPEDDKAFTVESLQKRKSFRPNYGNFDRTVFEALERDLKRCPDEAAAGVLFLLAKEPDRPPAVSIKHQAQDARIVICSGSTADADLQTIILQKLSLSWQEIVLVADSTKGQSTNPEWARVRVCRLTASNFGSILKKMNKKGGPVPSESFLRSLYVHRNLDRVMSIRWGKTHEKVALAKFQKDGGLFVQETGIWLHESGVLGASPDGLVGENGVIEVKCPYSCHHAANIAEGLSVNKTKKSAANKTKKSAVNKTKKSAVNKTKKSAVNKTKKSAYVVFQEDGVWKINPDHSYYHQLQASLYFTKRERGIFYIWTPNDFVSVFVEKDPNGGKNIPVLLSFYFDFFVPFVRKCETAE